MKPATTRRLLSIHRICGLIVSLNLLVFAVTGIILIFAKDIDDLTGAHHAAPPSAGTVSAVTAVAGVARARPGATPVYVFQDPEESPGVVFVGVTKGSKIIGDAEVVAVNGVTGELMTAVDVNQSFTAVVFRLHAQLWLGPWGQLLVGVVGLALLLSIVTGIIVYGPLMRRFAYGLLRRDKHRRTLSADIHKLLGISTLAWNLIVVLTGIVLSLGSVALQYYSATELAAIGKPYADEPAVTDLSTLDAAAHAAEVGHRGRYWSFVALPGTDFSSPRHYTILLRGGEGLESKMVTLILADAKDPSKVTVHELPLYLRTLLISEPFHFGDYGGRPLQIVWALFALLTIGMSLSGVYVTFAQRFGRDRRRRDALGSATEAVAEPAESVGGAP